ncbi:MAG: ATP-binding protein [Trueperaceae bacterium]|nr:ATP-binding protein [Trueperaceae bacterium]
MKRIWVQLLGAMLLVALVSMLVVPTALTLADRAAYARLPDGLRARVEAFSRPAPLIPRGGGPRAGMGGAAFQDDATHLALLLRDQRALRRNAVVIGALMAVTISAALAILLSRGLARPIEAVSRAAARLAEGRLDARATLPHPGRAPHEVRALARDFDAMATALERLEHEREAMIADVAHELRNPLATLSMRLEAAADGLVALDDAEVTTLRGQVDLLTRLVNDLRTLSQADAGRLSLTPEALDLREPVREAAAAYRPSSARAGLHMVLELPDSPLPADADRDRIRQVLHNLLENAFRHTPEGGTVTLRAAARADGVVRISVRNTGSGIHVEPPEAIFERFVHERPRDLQREGGSGLGLAIVRTLVTLHGGRVFARDHGDGAEVGFELPGGG